MIIIFQILKMQMLADRKLWTKPLAGSVRHFVKPFISYHSTKNRGEFTHYGDQMLVLLKSVSPASDFDINHFAESWKEFFKDYTGYIDQATKATLENFSEGKGPGDAGSTSSDLSGASRIAPLIYRYREDLGKMVRYSRAHTPSAALKEVLEENFKREPFTERVTDGMDSADMDTRKAISDFGQMCEVEAAFPSTVHLIAKYENDLKTALVENAMAGGDSAARGMITGLILGAHLGYDAIPGNWLSDLKYYQEITQLLENIDRGKKLNSEKTSEVLETSEV